ncbi:MAG TPA: glutamate-1-semialdehyde 2,1-aminomutase [Candidatus Thermoplasmatota archaeon]|nr:glutamate-1-semialdehyde 2,1-aminomutase [Candidatus Thermoplasmatota archaeon]
MRFARSKALSARAHEIIPAGCHTYSKGDDQFPELAPGFIERADGSTVWDVDGNEFLDWGMGLRSVLLGYGHPRVLDAVRRQLEKGPNFTRPSPIEVELAEELVATIPSAQMVKFAKNGSDVTTAAVRLARAFTGRDTVAFCQGPTFFSFDDWFIGTTPPNNGVPRPVSDLSLPFRYNDIASLERIFEQHPDGVACVILEAATLEHPRDEFLKRVRDLAHRHGALLILDEMITGFRWHERGAQAYYGVTPDLSTFGKAIANGFSVAVLAGRRDIMELGGLRHDKHKVFLLSSTHGAETHSLAACLATVREVREKNVVPQLWKTGELLQSGMNKLAEQNGLSGIVSCEGISCSPFIVTRNQGREADPAFRALFLQEMVRRGVLIPYLAISAAHGPAEVERTLEAADGAFRVYRKALDEGVHKHLVGRPVKPVFRKYN